MTNHNAIVRLACHAISVIDVDTLRSRVFAPSLRWHEPGRNLIAGDYEGCDEVLTHLIARLAELTGGTFHLEHRQSMGRGPTAVGLVTATATRHGQVLESHDVCLLTVRNGRIEEGWPYHHDQHGWDRFWS